ncbi:MAG: outer membrane lipoprotein-sorting protein [Deltaproteobacteria bacterium]|nr:outer membrane lipoprotein-sorting protein [Deltaproteobacteria bacterium]
MCLIASLLFTVFPGHTTSAYVLPGRLVIQLMLGNLNPPRAMVVEQNVTFFDQDGVATVFRERNSYMPPGRFRSESNYNSEIRIHVESSGSAITLVNGSIVESTESIAFAWMDRYKDLFCFRSRNGLAARLEASGMDVNISSPGRFGDMLVYILGDVYPHEAKPQLWVDKESFKPVRWIVVPKEKSSDGLVREIRYLAWRSVNHAWYPGRIEFYAGESMIKTIDVLTMDVNPDIPLVRFDVESIVANHLQPFPRPVMPVNRVNKNPG